MAKKLLILSAFLLSFNAHAILIGSGTGEIYGTWSFDFETSALCSISDLGCDVFWEQMTETERQLAPIQNAGIIALGSTDFSSVSESNLLTFAYGATPIEGPPGSSLLDVGNVFAVNTREGNYALVEVTGYSTEGNFDSPIFSREYYDIHIRYDLYDGQVSVPEPGILSLMALGLLGVAFQGRKRIKSC